MSDDAYTNAVARRNLEFATAAARRLGVAADPRWAEVAVEAAHADRLRERILPHLRGCARLHARAGSPRCSPIPLGVADERRGQAQPPRSGRRTARGRGPGSDDGHHAPVGGRRRAGRPAPGRLAPSLQLSESPEGPVPAAVGNAHEQRGELPDRRRRLPAAGDLRLHRPPAGRPRPRAGLPARAALAASRRLVLRNVHVRGKRYDVVVDSTGRRVVPHEAAAPR